MLKQKTSASLCLCILNYYYVNMFLRPVGSKRYASPMSLIITMSLNDTLSLRGRGADASG